MEKINYELESKKTNRLIIIEWISTMALFIVCFAWLYQKSEKQADRSDKLYEMFISVQKETKDMFISTQKENKDMFIDFLKETRK